MLAGWFHCWLVAGLVLLPCVVPPFPHTRDCSWLVARRMLVVCSPPVCGSFSLSPHTEFLVGCWSGSSSRVWFLPFPTHGIAGWLLVRCRLFVLLLCVVLCSLSHTQDCWLVPGRVRPPVCGSSFSTHRIAGWLLVFAIYSKHITHTVK